MSFFDPQDKKNKPILDYFDNKTWLIIDSSAQTRASIKKALAMIGARINNIFDADNSKEASSIIVSKKPNFILGSQQINGGLLTSLFPQHLKNVPNRLTAGFFLVSEERFVTEIAATLEYEMDGIITLPYTGFTIFDTVLAGMGRKINPSPYTLKLEEAKQFYFIGEVPKATELFLAATELHTHPYEAYFFLGQIYEETHFPDKAKLAYEESFAHNSQYFRTLKNLGNLYYQSKDFKKAYEINFQMVKKYPVAPEKIPELIRLSIINKKYEDINNYLKIFSEMKTTNTESQVSMSAGLAVLGKYFVHNNEIEKGVYALKAAYKFSNGKYEILENIMSTFEECRSLHVLLELFDSTDLSLWSENIQGLYFHTLHLVSSDDAMVFTIGEQLIRKKIKSIHIYRGLIERAIRMGRKPGKIEALVLEAINYFPDNKDEFEKMFQQSKENV